VLSNAVDGPVQWKAPFIECVLQGIASLHAHGMEHELARTSMQGMHADGASDEARLWRAELGRYAGRWLGRWLGPAWRETHERACDSLPTEHRTQAGQPHTLIHGDFNPRNFVLRDTPLGPKLCAFDWELAAWGLPQRDVVEFLAFVLPPDAESATIRHWLDVHRRAIERRAAVEFDTKTWYAGVRSAVADFGATRLPMYFLAHRFRPQPFLERVARTWWRLACVLGTQA
jgi:aminoglycoside/choline kinase family phosphotransferase